MKACFFANVADRKLLDLMEWYRQDIQLLRDLAFEVKVATETREIPWDSDFYFSWWCTSSIFPLIVARARRKPLIIMGYGSEVVNSMPSLGYKTFSILKRAIVRACLGKASLVLSISEAMKQEALNLVSREYSVVYLALDTEFYYPTEAPNVAYSVVTISHLNKPNMERKALREIIYAIPHVLQVFPEQRFVMAGSKLDAYEELSELAKTLGIRSSITFPGRVSNDEKLQLLQRSPIYLQPTRHEGFGMAIAEAMSCGAAVVTSRIGSVPEVTGNICSYASPSDPIAIANAITTLLAEPAQIARLSKAGRKWVTNRFALSTRRDAIKELLAAHFVYSPTDS